MHRIARVLLGGVLIVCSLAGGAWAQKNVLTAEVDTLPRIVRAGVPTVVDIKLTSASQALLEGRLILQPFDGRERFSRVVVDDLVLTTGEQTVRTMLPAIGTTDLFGQIHLQMTFEGTAGRIELGEYMLRASQHGKRFFVIGLCEPWGSASARRVQMLDNLRLEQFAPRLATNSEERAVVSGPAHLRPGDMPADPVSYCSFDLLLLVDEGFSLLREPQLRAIAAWVEAGGSLCLAPVGILAAHHVAFLNDMVSADDDASPFLLDAAGRLTFDAGGDPSFRKLRKGLGRVVLWTAPAGVDLQADSPQWREAVAHLWKIRRDRWKQIQNTGDWEVPKSAEQARAEAMQAIYDPYQYEMLDRRLSYMPLASAEGLFRRLMPSSVRLLPLSTVGLILLLYVLAIGPADYFLLGYLRQRKLTWIVFPLTTVAFTLFTVWLSHEHMKTTENEKSITLFDLGDRGRIVRQNRFDLVFSGTSRTETAEVRREMFTALNHQRFVDLSRAIYASYQPEHRLVAPATYAGRVPSRYSVAQHIPQWTPQLNRRFSIEPREDAEGRPNFDWDAVTAERLKSPSARLEIKKQLQQAFGHDATIRLYHQDDVHRLAGALELFPINEDLQRYYQNVWGRTGRHYSGDFLRDVCVRRQPGLFSVVSQISPTGGDNFEDLTLLDPSDPQQWLLVVAVDRGDELLIHRKLYVEQ